jgi:low temperature requirement protein LtrA
MRRFGSPARTARRPPPYDRRVTEVRTPPGGAREPELDSEAKTVSPLELFFDLVFVFAITQVTALLADDPTWGGLARGMLLLTAVWWAWAAYAWLTNEVDPDRAGVRVATFTAMVAMLCGSLALPEAFGAHALLFALAYLAIRFLHVALFAAGTDDVGVHQATRALAPSAVFLPLGFVAASFLDSPAQELAWVVVLVLDLVTGGLRGIGGWRLSPGHFVERHGLIMIIALGESIVAIGVGAEGSDLGAGELAAAALGVVTAAALWWTYFDRVADLGEHALEARPAGRERNTLARDSFSYLHVAMVAGIVLFALGMKKTLEHVEDPLKAVPAVGVAGGVALYLVALVAFEARNGAPLDRPRLLAAAACAAIVPVAIEVPALVASAAVAAVCAALVAYELRAGAAPGRPGGATHGGGAARAA